MCNCSIVLLSSLFFSRNFYKINALPKYSSLLTKITNNNISLSQNALQIIKLLLSKLLFEKYFASENPYNIFFLKTLEKKKSLSFSNAFTDIIFDSI